jgi:hypothetical protein
MHRMHRAIAVLPALVLALAACSAPGSGAGGDDDQTTEPMGSMPAATESAPASSAMASGSEAPMPSGEAGTANRVDMVALAEDPSSYADQSVTVLARIDEVVVDDEAFVTSPSGTDEDQLLVVLGDDARVDKDLDDGNVVWVDGTVVAIDDLESAGAELSGDDPQLADFDGDYAIVADGIRDPLGDEDDG